MTGRERLIKVLNGEKVDRIPNAPFIFYNTIDEYVDNQHASSLDSGTNEMVYVEKGIELYEKFGFDIILRTANCFDYLTEISDTDGKWQVNEVREGDDDNWSIVTEIKTPERTLTQKKNYHRATPHEIVEAVTEYPIKDSDDFDQFVKYQPPMRTFNCEHISRARDILGDRGIIAPWAQGAFNSSSFFRALDQLIMDPYTDMGFYKRMMDYFSERMFVLIKQLADAGADLICAGGNVANGKTAGPAFFQEFVLPFEVDFTKRVKDLGVYYLYHNCGDARSLYDVYSPIKMSIFETLTAPPYSDGDVKLAFESFDSDIVLSGNIDQIDLLVNGTPAEIRKSVKDLTDIAKPYSNFILAASDYFTEGTPYENIQAFSDAGLEYGVY
ncbi:MAG: hypothetical protein HN368_24265 [Spirochaetales bacterium]|nr:hypothetical protein [Spirochaetales bacterium]